jgi:broad specificity phosphatase PhoE
MSATRKLFIMRHAESLEDIDQTAYERIADEDIPLTDFGKEQAARFGQQFANEIGRSENLRVFLSPSKRVLETAQLVVSGVPKHVRWSLVTDSLISKQDWGNVTIHNRAEIEKERYRIGVLRYRFPGGESGAEMLFRFDLFAKKLGQEISEGVAENFLVITHGFELRVLLKSLLGWTEEYFESLAHPLHCEMKRVAYDNGSFLLLDEMRIYDPSGNPNFVRRQKNS